MTMEHAANRKANTLESPSPRAQVQRQAAILALCAALGLGAAFALKAPCTDRPWDDRYQYQHYCYSDLVPLYFGKHLDTDTTQYVHQENEYPVLTGLYMGLVARLTTGLHAYMQLSFLGLLVAAALATVALYRMGLPPRRIAAWCLLPPLVLHGLTNWDLIAVALSLWGWHAWTRQQPFAAALLFGLGGAAKLYPAFFLPFLLLDCWRRLDRPSAWRVAGGSVTGFVLPNAAVAALSPAGWLATYTFHARRPPDFETLYESFLHPYLEPLLPGMDWGAPWTALVGGASTLMFLGAVAWLSLRVYRKGLDPLMAGTLLTLVFLLTNRVYAPQYTLWVLPLLLYLRVDRRLLLAWVAADTLVFLVRYQLFTPVPGGAGWNYAWQDWSRLAIDVRWIALALITWRLGHRSDAWPRFRALRTSRPVTAQEMHQAVGTEG